MKGKEAVYLFNKYADARGLISQKYILAEGFTINEAEEEGLVIKEKIPKYSNRIISEKMKNKGNKK